jgi:hypothetical protein
MIGALAKSMGLGTLAALLGSVFHLGVVVTGFPKTSEDLKTCAFVTIVALIASLTMVVTATIVVGLPITKLLKRAKFENLGVYVFTGAAVGLIAPLLRGPLVGLPILTTFWHVGCFSGAITALTWWMSYRRQSALNH